MMTDRQLIDRRDELARLFTDGPLGRPPPNIEAIDQAISEAEAMVETLGTTGARAELDLLLRERDDTLDAMVRREHWIDDHAHLLGEYTDVRQELDRRVAARALLYQTNPPDDLLRQIGPRLKALDPQAWDGAVAVYAETRLEAGPDIDLNDLATHRTGPWRDAIRALHPIEEKAPSLRLTG